MTPTPPLFRPAFDRRPDLVMYLDDQPLAAQSHDSVITALLSAGEMTGQSEFDGGARSGFCLMGACQDCTIWDDSGRRLRACMTPVTAGMRLYRRARLPLTELPA